MIRHSHRLLLAGHLRLTEVLAILMFIAVGPASADPQTTTSHAVTIHSTPKYPSDFGHLDYVNPNAPKGGTIKLAARGSFDSLNAFILKGVTAAGVGGLFDTLTQRADDEPSTDYGLVAQTIETADDGSWVAFHLRKQARFHDGTRITPDDVIFSFNVLKKKGHPFYKTYYQSVVKAEQHADWAVKFTFKGGANPELPAILGQLPILSKRYYSTQDFTKTSLEPPIGSGPYRVVDVDPGRSISYQRDPDYWGRNLPINRGRYNFDKMIFEYYRDVTVMIEAFKSGEFDFRQENNSKLWATGYRSRPLRQGLIKKILIPHELPAGMQGFVFNLRRSIFQDVRVRQALGLAFDFEWTNKNLFYSQYARSYSYFTNSELAATELPSTEELALLEPYRDLIPPEVLTKVYRPPVTGNRGIRGNLRKALSLLKSAGWSIQDKRLTNAKGEMFKFELLLVHADFERVALPYAKNLERLGINMSVRTVDSAQYKKRLDDFDFDMVLQTFGQSLSPGNEQRDFWGSKSANTPGGRNIIGIQSPVVDALVASIIAAPDRTALVQRSKVLDRVLLWGHYVVPNWHINAFRVAYWDKFGRPSTSPKYGLGLSTWWVDAEKAARIEAAQSGPKSSTRK